MVYVNAAEPELGTGLNSTGMSASGKIELVEVAAWIILGIRKMHTECPEGPNPNVCFVNTNKYGNEPVQGPTISVSTD